MERKRIFAISGVKNSGKTTLICRLLEIFKDTHAINQPNRAGLTGTGAGAVFNDAVFHQHQRQPPVDQNLRRC